MYCLYCRARGSELVSPEDLLNACAQFEATSAPYRLKTFPNGVCAVQSFGKNDDAIADEVLETAKKQGYVSALSYSQALGVSVLVAQVGNALV